MDKSFYMNEAIKEAYKAYEKGETPIGAVIVKDGEIITSGHGYQSLRDALSENTLNIPKSFFASHISNQSLIILSLLSISQRLPCQFNFSASLSCSNSITSKMPQFRASQIRTSVSMLMFLPLPMLAIIFVVRPAASRKSSFLMLRSTSVCQRGL